MATPKRTHFEIAKAAVEAGFNVMCEKPMKFDLDQAERACKGWPKSPASCSRSGIINRKSVVEKGGKDLGGNWERSSDRAT